MIKTKKSEEFDKTIADLKSGTSRLSPLKFYLSDPSFHDDVKMRRYRLGHARFNSLPADTTDPTPSELLVLKVKAKIDQQISPRVSQKNIVKPFIHIVNREQRPRQISLKTADSMPAFECPFNMIKNIQRLQAERLMKEHAERMASKLTTPDSLSRDLVAPCCRHKSRSSIELHPSNEDTIKGRGFDDSNENNNDSLLYRDLLHYLTGQVTISRGSIEEFHRASQPDLFLLCISKMRSGEAIAAKNSLDVVDETTNGENGPRSVGENGPRSVGEQSRKTSPLVLTDAHLDMSSELSDKESDFLEYADSTGEDHNTNRCDSLCTQSAATSNTAVNTAQGNNPPGTQPPPMLGPEIRLDDDHFQCPIEIHWSVYVRHNKKPVSLSVVSTITNLPNMTAEQLDIYTKFISHLGMLHRKGVDVVHTRSDLIAKLENDKLIRLQIENTGLRIKNRDMELKLKRAEDILNLGPGDNEEGSLVDKLLKNTQYYMQELERVTGSLQHDKNVIRDLDHAQQQLIDDYSRRENELEVQAERLVNELDMLREKHQGAMEDNNDLEEENKMQQEKICDLEDELVDARTKTEAIVKDMEDDFKSNMYAKERAHDAMADDLRRVTEDYNWAMNERELLDKENNELSEETAALQQFINELQVDLAIAETKAQSVYETEERLAVADRTVQEQRDDLCEWEQEYTLVSSRMNELLDAAAELKSENHTLRRHIREQNEEIAELVEENDDFRDKRDNVTEEGTVKNERVTQQPKALTPPNDDGTLEAAKEAAKEATKEAECYKKAAKKQSDKMRVVKDQLNAIQTMHTAYQQHMNFKYKNIVKEFKKKIRDVEAENGKLTSQIHSIIFTNDTLNQTLAHKNIEVSKMEEALTSAQKDLKQMTTRLCQTEEALAIEQDHQMKLETRNQELLEHIKKLKTAGMNETDGDAMPQYVKQLHKMVAALGEQIKALETSRRQPNQKRDEIEFIHELKDVISQLDAELTTERMMHDVTKKCLRSAEEDLARLRQQAARSVYTRSTSSDCSRQGTRMEQIAHKINQHQMKAQYMMRLHPASSGSTPRSSLSAT